MFCGVHMWSVLQEILISSWSSTEMQTKSIFSKLNSHFPEADELNSNYGIHYARYIIHVNQCHNMETPSTLLVLCEGNHQWFLITKGQKCVALMFSLLSAQTSCWTKKWDRVANNLRHSCDATNDVTLCHTFSTSKPLAPGKSDQYFEQHSCSVLSSVQISGQSHGMRLRIFQEDWQLFEDFLIILWLSWFLNQCHTSNF